MKNEVIGKYKIVFSGFDTNGVTLLKDEKIVTNYYNVPNKVIEKIANYFNLYLHGETSYNTGKDIKKVSKVVNKNGGIVNLFSTESKAKYNKFIVNYTRG